MKITFISDTHGQHHGLRLPEDTDILVHAGDVSKLGKVSEVKDFIDWFSGLPYRYKIFIAGNHDFLMEKNPAVFRELLNDKVIYLENEAVEVEGIRFWGSPITPWFFDWAFNVNRGAPIAKYWQEIPKDTDILITHGPPYGIGDRVRDGKLVGCEALAEKIPELDIKYHVFGHIHEAYGAYEKDGVQYINASVLNLSYQLVNAPISIDWK